MAETGEGDRAGARRAPRRIDAIDAEMHRLLIERGTVIDSLITTKGTEPPGAAFRPGREAEMMRRLVARHEGALPLATVEHIWREIITDLHAHAGAVRRRRRHFGRAGRDARSRPLLFRLLGVRSTTVAGAGAVVARVSPPANDLGLIAPAPRSRPVVARARRRRRAAHHGAAALHPGRGKAGRLAGLRHFAAALPIRRRRRHRRLRRAHRRRAGEAVPAVEILARRRRRMCCSPRRSADDARICRDCLKARGR